MYSEADGSGGVQNKRIGIGTTTPSASLSVGQSADTVADGLWIAASDGDYRSIYMNTSQVMNFTGGAGNTATLSSSGAWTSASDVAYKHEIYDIPYGLDEVMLMQPRVYEFKNIASTTYIGFIAQELDDIIPEVVYGEDGHKTVSYGELTAVLTHAIQQLNTKVEEMAGNVVEGAYHFASIVANKITTKELCLDDGDGSDLCITEGDLRTLLAGVGETGHSTEVVVINATTTPDIIDDSVTVIDTVTDGNATSTDDGTATSTDDNTEVVVAEPSTDTGTSTDANTDIDIEDDLVDDAEEIPAVEESGTDDTEGAEDTAVEDEDITDEEDVPSEDVLVDDAPEESVPSAN